MTIPKMLAEMAEEYASTIYRKVDPSSTGGRALAEWIAASEGFEAGARAALKLPEVQMMREALSGCSGGNCRLTERRGGMHTNGGCHCRDRVKEARELFDRLTSEVGE